MIDVIKKNWMKILLALKEEYEISDISFRTWVLPLIPYTFQNHTLTVILPDLQHLNYIKRKYGRPLAAVISEILGISCQLQWAGQSDIEGESEEEEESDCRSSQREETNVKTDSQRNSSEKSEWYQKYRWNVSAVQFVEIKKNWEQILLRLKEEVGDTEIAYQTWLLPLVPHSFMRGVLTILAPSQSHLRYVQEEYGFHLEAIISALLGTKCKIKFQLMEKKQTSGDEQKVKDKGEEAIRFREEKESLLDAEFSELIEKLSEEKRLENLAEILQGSDYNEKLCRKIFEKIEDDWSQILSKLKENLKLSDTPFQLWILPLKPYSFQSRILRILVPNEIFLRHIKYQYASVLSEVVSERLGIVCTLEFVPEDLLQSTYQKGFQKGEERLAALIGTLMKEKRIDEVLEAVEDPSCRLRLYSECETRNEAQAAE